MIEPSVIIGRGGRERREARKTRAENENGPRKKKTFWRSCGKILLSQAKEFCLSTGLHGYKYIAQEKRSPVARVIWAISVFASLACAIALTQIAWEYNASHPTLTVIESTHHGIWNYPFPGVTLCDINRVSFSRAQNLVRSLKNGTYGNSTREEIIKEMRILNELLDPGIFDLNITANLSRLQDIFDRNDLSIGRVIRTVTRNCSEMIPRCKWKGIRKPCATTFYESLSRDGFCCSFNYLGALRPDEIPSSSFPLRATRTPGKDGPEEPKRVTACGYQTGLTVLVNPDPNDYHSSLFGVFGLKLMIHDPYDYPDRHAEFKFIGTGVEVFVSVSPEITYSTPGVRDLPIATRDCVFHDEGRELNARATSGRYSYHNCLANCRLRTILRKCGCVPYYYANFRRLSPFVSSSSSSASGSDAGNASPNATNGNPTRLCTLKDIDCAIRFRDWYDTSWPGTEVKSNWVPWNERKTVSKSGSKPPIKRYSVEHKPCDCAFDCTLVRYPLESSSGPLDRNNSYNDLAFFKGVPMTNRSVVHVFFSDLVSTQYRRDVYYNWHNLFASFGGLLGLFAGFSLMSGFELIYFFTIRLVVDIWTKRKTPS